MKKPIAVLFLLFTSIISIFAQKETGKIKATSAETNRFYYFEIPASINGSYVDPSPISNVTANFIDTKLSLKLGFPSMFKEAPATKDLKNSGFIQPYAKAVNGASTLWKANSAPAEIGVTGGYSRILFHNYWVYKDEKGSATENHSSEAMTWVNLIGSVERGNYNLFNSTESFNNIMSKQTETNGSVYVSLNRYFFSKIPRFRLISGIWSLGIGYARTNNYTSLKSKTYQEGRIVYNADSTMSQSAMETTSGREGALVIYKGLSCFGELYYPLIRNKTYGSLYFGNRITFYSIDKENKIANFNTGFYINLKDKKPDGDKPAKDVVNFSITAQFNQINKSSEQGYMDKNFTVLLQAAVPIRFN